MSRSVAGSIEAEYRRYRELAERAMDQLGIEEICREGPGGGNSIATLVWHLSGNLASRFTDFLTSDGEKPWREREEEFAPRRVSREELEQTWRAGWDVLFGALEKLDDEDLARSVSIRGVELSVIQALERSLAHTSYHVGQIVYAAKALRGDAWDYLSIPPGGTKAYNQDPTREKPPPSS